MTSNAPRVDAGTAPRPGGLAVRIATCKPLPDPDLDEAPLAAALAAGGFAAELVGWDEARVREVLDHYENQTEDEQFAEIEAALEKKGTTMIAVPDELADEVRALIARNQRA